jgi:hypothetical protein
MGGLREIKKSARPQTPRRWGWGTPLKKRTANRAKRILAKRNTHGNNKIKIFLERYGCARRSAPVPGAATSAGRLAPRFSLGRFPLPACCARDGRTYSPSKVIHRWRGARVFPAPQPAVNNFGGGRKMFSEQSRVLPDPTIEHAGSGRRIAHSSVSTLFRRVSLRNPAPCRKGILRTLRLQVQTWQRRTSISPSVRQGLRAQHNAKH